MSETKVCKKCGEIKVLNEFSRHPTCKGGYNTHCKTCVNIKSREWYVDNKERDRENGKRWYAENKEKRAASNKIYADANKERIRELTRIWDLENKERRSATGKAYYEKNKERKAETTKLYELNNRDRISARKKSWREKNKEKISVRQKRYYEVNKERIAFKSHLWRRTNPEISNAAWTRRQAAKVNATPSWANVFFIREIYSLAHLRTRLTGVRHHVDHIVPLKSKVVQGLHCEANLQILTAFQNISKGNKHWPDMP